ncbi:hypothetical protein GNI_026850, partial [Gregarina niphandrodes]
TTTTTPPTPEQTTTTTPPAPEHTTEIVEEDVAADVVRSADADPTRNSARLLSRLPLPAVTTLETTTPTGE